MASCRFCLIETADSWWGNYCVKCHKLQRIIALFSIDKVMGIVESVLIVSEEQQKENIKEELKVELTTRASSIRKSKRKEKILESIE